MTMNAVQQGMEAAPVAAGSGEEASYLPYRDSTPERNDVPALRRRMSEDGYLFLSGLLPADAVGALRERILELCRAQGWADAEGNPQGAARLEGQAAWWEVYDPLQKSRVFHALAHRAELMGVMERLFGEAALVHPRNIARITFPDAAFFTTPAHQDFPLIQGTPETYTAWMPLVDCPMKLGGLAMLAGSHRFGMLPMRPAQGPGGLEADTEPLRREQGLAWHAQDLRAGDVLIFHSHTVHRALPNVSGNRLRLSADFRYQAASQPVVADSLEPHYGRLTWEEIYADWDTSDDLRYYWKRLLLTVVERNAAVQTPTLPTKEESAVANS